MGISEAENFDYMASKHKAIGFYRQYKVSPSPFFQPQHMQQQMMQQQQMQMPNNPQMFMPQNVPTMGNPMGMGGPSGVPPRPPFNQGVVGNPNIGPLAYLEKTTNNIDLGDGRR